MSVCPSLYNFHVRCQWREEESTTSIGTWDKYLSHICTLAHMWNPSCPLPFDVLSWDNGENGGQTNHTSHHFFLIIFLLLSDSYPQALKQITNDKYIFFLVLSFIFICFSFLFIGLLLINLLIPIFILILIIEKYLKGLFIINILSS